MFGALYPSKSGLLHRHIVKRIGRFLHNCFDDPTALEERE
jgi:hypothetical protein